MSYSVIDGLVIYYENARKSA